MKKSELKKLIKEEIRRLKEDYNGWSNWDTWNAYNWICVDENTYKIFKKAQDGKDAEKIFKSKYGKNKDQINYHKVDWEEVYDAIEEDR